MKKTFINVFEHFSKCEYCNWKKYKSFKENTKKNQIKSLNNEEITFGKISALKAYTDTKSYKEENSFKIKKIEFLK